MLKSELLAAIMTVPVLLFFRPDKMLFAFGMLAFPPVIKLEEEPFIEIEVSMVALLAEPILIPRFELPALIIGPLPILLL